jgi:ubiquinone/menaquinone biosynthesis C-methylase UbiE
MSTDKNRVCPVELAGALEGRIRRLLQNPDKILAPFVREGMTTLDVGCGPGFFSVELGRLVGPNGRVLAADLQQGMLDRLRRKIDGTALEQTIRTVKCENGNLNVSEMIDFGLAFWMVHEVPDKASFFRQLRAVLKDTGQILLVEPKLFHVSRSEFEATVGLARQAGFSVGAGPSLLLSWSAVLRIAPL